MRDLVARERDAPSSQIGAARIDARKARETQHAQNTMIRIGSLEEIPKPKTQDPNPKSNRNASLRIRV
jgi:hypothetical protein